MKQCPRCKIERSLDQFYTRRGVQTHSYCKPCVNRQTMERQRNLKRLAVEYKGGQCTICGYSRCLAALEFHHLDPSQKDFTLSHRRSLRFNDEVKAELDKCILVCANCHREQYSSPN